MKRPVSILLLCFAFNGGISQNQQKVDSIEAQVEAFDLTRNNDLESQFKALEADESIEQELEQWKKQEVNG